MKNIWQHLCSLFALALLAYSLVGIFYTPYQIPKNATETKQNAQEKQDNLKFLEVTLEKNIFGAAILQNEEQKSSENRVLGNNADIPVSSLSWKLLGTVVGDNQESFAILNINGQSALYHQGAQVEAWKIAQIERESIILANGTRKERLLLRKKNKQEQADKKIKLNKNELLSLFANPSNLLSSISLMPFQNQEAQGLRIVSIKQESPLGKLKLQDNDILLSLDNHNLVTFDSLKHFQSIRNQNSFLLKIYRGKTSLIYNYTF